MREDKAKTCELLAAALKSTRQYSDLLRLAYTRRDGYEEVTPVYVSGKGRPINVTMDSGWAVIKDVIRGLNGGEL